MNNININFVDICCGLSWGDEAKGKIVAELASMNIYTYVCRWSGGNNAGHSVYINNTKYKTHIIPCGVFYNIRSIIGPDCVINEKAFHEEIAYLKINGFNTDNVKISPKAHIILDNHIADDIKKICSIQGTTGRGIAPCYGDKFNRTGKQAKSIESFKPYIWDEILEGNILCEGAQGFWLDINQGNYPYTTSSTTLPYGACSLGFPPQLIRNVYGAAKMYDTRSGIDPEFPEDLLADDELAKIIELGQEYGTTTGRKRKVNWLNITKLIQSLNVTGTTTLIISKVDVIEIANIYKILYNNEIISFNNIGEMKDCITDLLSNNCTGILREIKFSNNVYNMETIL